MIDFNEGLAFQNGYGLYFFHHENKPLIWWRSGYDINYVVLDYLDDFFSKKYMRFNDMTITDFEYVFGDDIKKYKLENDTN